MKKRLAVALLTLILCLGLTTPAFAVTEVGGLNTLTIGNISSSLVENYPAGIDARGAGWTWNGSTRTFTLHDAQITGPCTLPNGAMVVLEGNNSIGALSGQGYSIKGSGSLIAGTISGNVVFRGTGTITVNDHIGNDYTNGWRIRIESGNIIAPSICEGISGTKQNTPDEIVITGGTIKLGSFCALATDVTITGGTILVDSNSATRFESELAAFKVDGSYRDGCMLGGHFTFIGGTLSIEGKTRMALMTEVGFLTEDLGCEPFASKDELLNALSKIPMLVQLNSGVSVTGGILCSSLVLDGYTPSVANKERYAGFSFSKDGQPFKYWWNAARENCVKTLSLWGPDQKPDQALLWEPTYESSKFTDLSPTGFYLDAVEWALLNSITTGTTGTTFSPNENCTHGQILTFLWRAAGSPQVDVTTPFEMSGSEYYYDAVKWAYKSGMMGVNFNYQAPCTRSAAVTYIWQAFGSPSGYGSNIRFSDVSSNARYAQAVNWAVYKHITTGVTSSTFNPDGICNRGQIVTFLYRAHTK